MKELASIGYVSYLIATGLECKVNFEYETGE